MNLLTNGMLHRISVIRPKAFLLHATHAAQARQVGEPVL